MAYLTFQISSPHIDLKNFRSMSWCDATFRREGIFTSSLHSCSRIRVRLDVLSIMRVQTLDSNRTIQILDIEKIKYVWTLDYSMILKVVEGVFFTPIIYLQTVGQEWLAGFPNSMVELQNSHPRYMCLDLILVLTPHSHIFQGYEFIASSKRHQANSMG